MVARLDKKLPAPVVKNVAAKPQEKAPKSLGGSFAKGGDSLSTGRGGALRQNAAKLLGSTGLSSNVPLQRNAGGLNAIAKDSAVKRDLDVPGALSAKASTVKQPGALNPKNAMVKHDFEARGALMANASFVHHDFDVKQVTHHFDGGGSLDPAVAAAAKNVEKAYASSSDPKARDKAVLEAIKKGAEQFANDPAKAAAYVSAIGPTVTKLATDLAARKDDKGIKGLLKDLGEVAGKLGTEATLALGASVARGLPDTKDLYYIDDALNGSPLALGVLVGLADQGKVNSARDLIKSTFGPLLALNPIDGWEVLTNAKFPPELAGPLAIAFSKIGETALASLFSAKALDPLAAATKAADDANGDVARLQGDLNQELQHVPQADRHAYEQLFWQEHQSALDAASKANEALKVEVEKSLPRVKALAAAGNEGAAKQLEKSLAALAKDPAQSDFVASTIEGLKVNGAFPQPFHEQELVDAFAAAKQGQANLLLATGDTAGAAKVLDDILGFLDTTQFLTTGIAELKKPLENFVGVLRTGDAKKITAYLTSEGEKDVLALSKSSQALGAVVTGLGIAVTLVKGFESGTDLKGALKTIFEASGPAAGLVAQGLEVLAGAVNSAALQTKLTSAAEWAGLLEKGLGKITGVIGVVTGVIDTIGSVRDVFDDANIQSIGAAVGSVLTTVGGALSLFPATAPVGAAVAVLGTAAGVLSNYIAAEEAESDRADETSKLLQQLYADPNHPGTAGLSAKERKALADHLAHTDVDLDALQKDAGLTDAQLCELGATTNGLSFESAEGWSLADVAKQLGLKGQAFVDFLQSHRDDFIDQVGAGWEPTGAIAFDTTKASNDVRNEHPKWTEQAVHEEVQKRRQAWRESYFGDWVRQVAGTTEA